jgi:hypothetical protein
MYKTPYGEFNGDSWEDFCQLCFKLKYEADGYQEMPAWQGDLGIEGFTRTGVLFQCYCPDADYNPDKLYEMQRDKITKDLGKLVTYENELGTYLNGIKAVKWIFVTPEYKKKDLVKHCQDKAAEYRKLISSILAPGFDVFVHDIEFYAEQIPTVLNFRNQKLDIESKEKKSPNEIADWKSKQISLVDAAVKKHSFRVPTTAKNSDSRVNMLTDKSVRDFLDGDLMIRKWSETYQDQYEKFQKVVDLFEERVIEKCAVNDGNSNQLYNEIENELKTKLKEAFSYLDDLMIDRLTNRVMADWILRCPISFE